MAKRSKKKTSRTTGRRTTTKARGKRGPTELIISKSRTKSAAGINVSGEFYSALDGAVRGLISTAEKRAMDNGRKTLRPYDL
jgi:hypothetical protein